MDSKRTYSARRMSDGRFDLLEWDHPCLHVKRILIFAIVHTGRSFGQDQHRLLPCKNDIVFAIRPGSTPSASAASTTVAVDSSRRIT